MQIAVEKCFVCTVSNSRHNKRRSGSNYGINNQAFAIVDNVRDLGVTIDSQLNFDKHIAGIVHKAMDRANLVLKTFHSRDRTFIKAFCTYPSYIRVLLSCLHGLHTLIVYKTKLNEYFVI